MLRLQNIKKTFKDKVAVHDLNLEVKKGEVFVLLGPTGAGKTTTLRIATGLEKPDEGTVWLEEEDITDSPPQSRDMAFVFEGLNLFPIYSVYDNIAFALRSPIYGENEKVIETRVRKISKDLRIDHLLDRKPDTLSGGEIQRVAVARALVRRPQLYLLDEPLSNLDLKLREELRAELKELHQKYESTILYATHDYMGAVSIADRIGILHEGELHQIGTQDELYGDPATTVVAALMGNPAMNFLTVRREGKRLTSTEDPEVSLELPQREADWVEKGGKDLLLGLWSEDIQVSLKPKEGFLKSELYGQEYRGADRIVSLAVGEETLKKMVEIDFPGRFGDPCWFTCDPAKIYLFDRETGRRIKE
jgi:multiple sugar transport system ATP-binding protein